MTATTKPKLVGILGGLGPMATVYFYEMLTSHTEASCDQDHIDIIIFSRATTPDRTAYILGQSTDNPVGIMKEDLARLVSAGAELIVMPCNTAHYFYDELSAGSEVETLNIVSETARFCADRGMKRIGILATEGTVKSGTYEIACRASGIEAVVPSPEDQEVINDIIYGQIKKGLPPDIDSFLDVCERLGKCDTLILGCTELSLLKKQGLPEGRFTDSLEVLAFRTIERCGKNPIGFDFQ